MKKIGMLAAAAALALATAPAAQAFTLAELEGWTLSRIAASTFNFSGARAETPIVGPECDHSAPSVEAACVGPNGYTLFIVDGAAGTIAVAGPDWTEAPVIELGPAARSVGLVGPIALYGRTVRWRADDADVARALVVRVVDATGARARVVVAIEPGLTSQTACVVNAFADGPRAFRASEEEARVANVLLCRR